MSRKVVFLYFIVTAKRGLVSWTVARKTSCLSLDSSRKNLNSPCFRVTFLAEIKACPQGWER